jgi:hypothetical protein
VLLTGETLYPGRLYVFDFPSFEASVERLLKFTEGKPLRRCLETVEPGGSRQDSRCRPAWTSADLHTRNLLLRSVIAKFVPLGSGEDAKKGRVAIGNPMSESKAADKQGQSSKGLFCARFPMRKPVTADYNRDETCNLSNGSGEKGLDRSESCVKG